MKSPSKIAGFAFPIDGGSSLPECATSSRSHAILYLSYLMNQCPVSFDHSVLHSGDRPDPLCLNAFC